MALATAKRAFNFLTVALTEKGTKLLEFLNYQDNP